MPWQSAKFRNYDFKWPILLYNFRTSFNLYYFSFSLPRRVEPTPVQSYVVDKKLYPIELLLLIIKLFKITSKEILL